MLDQSLAGTVEDEAAPLGLFALALRLPFGVLYYLQVEGGHARGEPGFGCVGRLKTRASSTAVFAAAMRANHVLWCAEPLFVDDYALRMLPWWWRIGIGNRLLSSMVADGLLGVFRPLHTENVLRLRYGEDRLDEAIAEGVDQYVILGAGFDTFALRRRDLAERLRVFEADHPATQRAKRDRLGRLGEPAPPNLTFVPVDFETEALDSALATAGLRTDRPAFFSWLGVTYYLSLPAIAATLRRVAACAAPGSRLLLDYKLPAAALDAAQRKFADRLDRFVARLGEPMVSTFTAETLAEEAARVGGRRLDDVPPEEQARRYLAGRRDIPAPAPNFAFGLYALDG